MKIPNARNIVRAWLFGLLLLCVSGLLLLLDPEYRVWQMLRIELASSATHLMHIIAENEYDKPFLQKCLYLDFAFLTGFTIIFIASALLISDKGTPSRKLLLALAVLPGLLDLAENILLLRMLDNESQMFALFPYYNISAIAKFILVVPAVVMACLVMSLLIRNALRKKKSPEDAPGIS